MNKIYFLLFVVCATLGSYFYGANIADVKCKMKYANDNVTNLQKINENKKVIHDTVYKTGVGDIRRILHDKYTIAQ